MLFNSTTTADPELDHLTVSFGAFVLDIDRGTLLKDEADVPLRPKSFEVLCHLVKKHGILVSRDELLDTIWPDVIVTEDSLTHCLIDIRKALEDHSRKLVRTIPRRGYLFDVPVSTHSPGERPPANLNTRWALIHRLPSVWSATAILILSLAIAASWWSSRESMPGDDTPGKISNDVSAIEDSTVPSTHQTSRAQEFYLRGKYFHNRRAPNDLDHAIQQFRQALDIDPDLADAWVGLAGSIHVKSIYNGIPIDFIHHEIKTALNRALLLQPDHAEAHLRMTKYFRDLGENQKASRHFDLALKHGQDNALVLSALAGYLLGQSRFEEAIAWQRRAVQLDPLGAVNRGNLGAMLYFAGRFNEAKLELLKALDLNPSGNTFINGQLLDIHLLQQQYDQAEVLALKLPESPRQQLALALVHFANGEPEKSHRIMEKMSSEAGVESALCLAEIHASRRSFDESFEWLEEATRRQSSMNSARDGTKFVSAVKNSHFLRPLRSDSRWDQWLKYSSQQVPQWPEFKIAISGF